MKRVLLPLIFSGLTFFGAGAQTIATDFTANDCSGTSHHLYAELDAGKVVVISFVEPCGSCIGPSGDALMAAQTVMAQHAGTQVLFYVSSQNGTYPCSSLLTWCTLNGLGAADAFFSDPALISTMFGVAAYMPRIVVIGGPGHKIFLNGDGTTMDTTTMKDAISNALVSTAVPGMVINTGMMRINPNPAKENFRFTYNLPLASDVHISVYNLIGTRVYSYSNERMPAGAHELPVDLGGNIASGVYFVKLTANGTTSVLRFVVEK